MKILHLKGSKQVKRAAINLTYPKTVSRQCSGIKLGELNFVALVRDNCLWSSGVSNNKAWNGLFGECYI